LSNAKESLDQLLANTRLDPPHHPEIIKYQSTVGAHCNIAWVGIGVEEAVVEQLDQVSLCTHLSDRFTVYPSSL
jgi:hypothetical protein